MSDDASTPTSKSTGSTILDNPQVYALLMSTIDERVAAGVRERNVSLRNWLIGSLTIAVIILTAGGAITLRYFVDEAVRGTVGNAVDAVRFNSEVAELNFRVLNLDLSEGFTSEEAESIIWAIESLIPKKQDAQRLGKLAFAVDTAVQNFAEANRLDLVTRLEDVASDLLLNSTIVIPTMLQANGFMLLADAGAPTSWTDTTGSRSEAYKSYRKYLDRAEHAGYPELYLLFEILLGYLEGRSAGVINNLIEDTDSLSDEDAEHFAQVITALATGAMTRESNAASKRVASRVTAFLCEYGERGVLLRNVSQQPQLQC